jgi:YpzG-like protein
MCTQIRGYRPVLPLHQNRSNSRNSTLALDQEKRFFPLLLVMSVELMANQRFKGPFQHPWSTPKHTWSQINGETKETQNLIILKRQTRKQA